jgi:hypothetical protein
MKRTSLAVFLLAALVIEGCSAKTVETREAPTATQTSVVEVLQEVRPGIYMSNDPADFPFPTSGYDVYIVGETHGNQEAKQVFQTYLKTLYEDAGVRDVVLEEDQGYESDANAYVQGRTETLPPGLCLRTDILGLIRNFNETLAPEEKVAVHLVEVDSPLSVVYKHLSELHERLGAKAESIQIPSLSEFETWSPRQFIDLLTELENVAAGQPDILHELETVRQSFRWHTMGNGMGQGTGNQTFSAMREQISTQNMQYLVTRLGGKPILAFYGAGHGTKAHTAPNLSEEDKSWGQRLNESGIPVYTLYVLGVSGNGFWRGESFQYPASLGEFQFDDGTFLPSLFERHPGTGILYADLRAEENKAIKLPPDHLDIPAFQVFDGLVIFKQFTPMEDACQTLK